MHEIEVLTYGKSACIGPTCVSSVKAIRQYNCSSRLGKIYSVFLNAFCFVVSLSLHLV